VTNASHPLRNVVILAVAQTLGSSGLTVVVILGGIIAAAMAPKASWATVPISLAIVATALTTVPAAMLMRRVGRRNGFMIGAGIGALGGLVASAAIVRADFMLFCAATLLLGGSMAFTQQYRFAAAESVVAERVSKAISYVLIGGLGAALLNPQIALAARWWIPDVEYAGSFIAVSVLYVAAILVLSRLQLPKPLPSPPESEVHGELHSSPQLRMAVFASASAYAVMSFLMTAAPISMHSVDHHNVEATTWVVQSHILAMYLPSLVTGHIVARIGERPVMMAGGVILAVCVVLSAQGRQFMHYWSGMVLLGLGWNLLFVAGTTLLARTVQGVDRHRVQALNDFTVFGSQACASLLAGLSLQYVGWTIMNLATLPLLAGVIFAASRLRRTGPAPAGPVASV
jgi:MFS family permease